MARLPDGTPLASLSIPGTHDSGAMFEPAAGIAKTQDLTIADQLNIGARYFDIRCRDVDDSFDITHGGIDQNQTFDDVLATMFAFLDANPSEALIVSVKEDAVQSGETMPFDAAFRGYIAGAPDRWYLDDSLPTLGQARGKLVLLRRFSSTVAQGIDGTDWADNATFVSGELHVEDNYVVTDNDLKWAAITDALAAATGDGWHLTYTSGYQTVQGLPNIELVSDDINARLDGYIESTAGPLGTLAMDFITADRAAAVVAHND